MESASRTLEKPNASRIETMIDEIVQGRMLDDQLDECDLTIAELARIKASFAKTLLSMMHGRIKYQKAVESKPSVSQGKPLLADDEEPVVEDSVNIVEATFAGPPPQPTPKKSPGRRSPPASAA